VAVGNDVVDLGDPAIATSHLRPRFVSRVLTEAERFRFAAAADPKAMLWACFAAKEAAYKAVAQVRPPPGFAYQRFEVAEDFKSVRFEDLVLHSKVWVSADRVTAVAWLGDEPQLAQVHEVARGSNPSAVARQALCVALAGQLGCDEGLLAVAREKVPGSWDGFGPPRVERDGVPVAAQVSLSHDGRFAAYAARLGR